MSEHFIILGLPRSMTAWVSCFMTCGDVFCQHELAGRMPLDEIVMSIQEQPFAVSGICDSGLTKDWEEIYSRFPDAIYIWLRRDCLDVRKSLEGIGMTPNAAESVVNLAKPALQEFLNTVPHEIFNFDEIQTREGASRLWECCATHHPLPPAHLDKMMKLRVSVDPESYREAADFLNSLTEITAAFA